MSPSWSPSVPKLMEMAWEPLCIAPSPCVTNFRLTGIQQTANAKGTRDALLFGAPRNPEQEPSQISRSARTGARDSGISDLPVLRNVISKLAVAVHPDSKGLSLLVATSSAQSQHKAEGSPSLSPRYTNKTGKVDDIVDTAFLNKFLEDP